MAKWLIKYEESNVTEFTVEADTLEEAVAIIQGENGLDEDPRHEDAWNTATYIDWMSTERVVNAVRVPDDSIT